MVLLGEKIILEATAKKGFKKIIIIIFLNNHNSMSI